MRILTNVILTIILLIYLPVQIGCQRKSKELSPFFDGLYFRYTDVKSSVRGDILYTIKKVGNKYEIIKDDSNKSNILGEIITYVVDYYGFIKETPVRVRKTSKKTKKLEDLKGRQICIWIPPKALQIGNIFKTSFLHGSVRVIEQTTWEGWDVWVLKDRAGNKCFYDSETGFMVGSQSISVGIVGSVKTILIDTNADIQL